MTKFQVLDTNSPEFTSLPVAEQIALLDAYLDRVEGLQRGHMRLKQAYATSGAYSDKRRLALMGGQDQAIANLQVIIDDGEMLLDRLRGQARPVSGKKGRVVVPSDDADFEPDPEIMRVVRGRVSHE